MDMRHVAAAVALIAIAACAPAAEEMGADSPAAAMADPASVRQAIDSANAKAEEALNKGDIETWITLYAPDAIVMASNQPAWRGTDGLRTGAQGMLSQFTLSGVNLNVEDVKVSGDLAVETGTYEMTMTPKQGKAINDKGKYIVVWQRQADGSWKIIRDIFNSDLPATTS